MSTVKVIVRAVACQVELCVVSVEVKVGGVGLDNFTDGSDVDTKKLGFRTEPWGTPQVKCLGSEGLPDIDTCWVLLVK